MPASGSAPTPHPLKRAQRRLPTLARGARRHPAIRKAIGIVEAHYASPEAVTREAVAEAVALSPDYFSRLFRRLTGLRFRQYVILVRIRCALQRLAERPYRSIDRIAHECGFGAVRTFQHHFKRLVGMTPSEYRADVQKWVRVGGADPEG